MFRILLLLGAGAVLAACGGGGGGGGSRAFPTITNEGLLPGITKLSAPAAAGVGATRIYVNDIPNTIHEGRVRHVVERLHPDQSALITDYNRQDTEDTFNSFNNYFAQNPNTVTVLPRGYKDKPYLMITYLERFSRQSGLDLRNLGLQVISAGNQGISFTESFDDNGGSRTNFLRTLNKKRTIIAVGIGGNGRRDRQSNYCEDWYVGFCVGASYYYRTDNHYVRGTSFTAPIVGTAAAVMKEQFKLTNDQTFDITTQCARRNPAGPGMVGAINLDCMFSPNGQLYAGFNDFLAAQTISVAAAVRSIPPTPGASSVQIPATYDSWGRNFGALQFEMDAQFTNTGLPSLQDTHRVVTHFQNGILVMARADDMPLFGMVFDNGMSIDGMIADQFFGISHDVYDNTKSIRLGYSKGYSIGDTALGANVHYIRQHADGDVIFSDIKGHAVDAEIRSTLDLGIGALSLSLSHDRFLGGSFRFLGRSGTMGQVHETGLNLGYRYDF